jgi:hypothetical protein
MSQLRLREGLTIRPLPGGDAVVASASGAEAVIVNTSAYAILELLTEASTTEDALVEVFVNSFPDQDPAAIRRDVTELVAQLMRLEIVEPCGGAPSTA